MATRGEMRDLCRRRLGDLTAPLGFSDLQINQWVNDAIGDYSAHFPRELTADVSTSAGTREYSLSSLTSPQAVIEVEYPKGEDPPEYLTYRDEHDPRGFYGGDFYVTKGDPVDTIVIGPEPAGSETIAVRYQADHDYPDQDSDTLTVPDRHLEALVLFVRWAAIQEIESTEERDPDPTTIMVTMQSQAAARAERSYRRKIREYKDAQHADGGGFVHWGMLD